MSFILRRLGNAARPTFIATFLKDAPRGKSKNVVAMLKAVHAQEDISAARERAAAVVEKLRSMRLASAAKCFADGVEETLSYMAFPREHWTRILSNNMLERIMKEIRRRKRVVGAFLDGQSALMLVAARRRHISGMKWGTLRYRDMDRLHQSKETNWTAPLLDFNSVLSLLIGRLYHG